MSKHAFQGFVLSLSFRSDADSLAVILIDFPAFSEFVEDFEKKDLQEGYFIAASRARQLLGAVSGRLLL